jgi:hypothetical protein
MISDGPLLHTLESLPDFPIRFVPFLMDQMVRSLGSCSSQDPRRVRPVTECVQRVSLYEHARLAGSQEDGAQFSVSSTVLRLDLLSPASEGFDAAASVPGIVGKLGAILERPETIRNAM